MSEWVEYKGTDEQIEKMRNAEHGFIFRDDNGAESRGILDMSDHIVRARLKEHLSTWNATHYLICNPHPLANMIERWAETGQPVWIRKMFYCGIEKEWQTYATTTPDWNIPGAED